MKRLFFGGFALLFVVHSLTAQVQTTFEQVVYDMVGEPFRSGAFSEPWGAHEGELHGVPVNYDWAAGARPGTWINYSDNQAISTWGQVYEWKYGSPEKNIRVHIRNMQTFAFADGSWQLIEENNIAGTNFTENFASASSLSDVRTESSGGISVTMVDGYNYHWWISKWPRTTLPTGTEAIFVTCQVRLIPNTDPEVDLTQAKYLAGVSNDYYPDPTASGSGPWPSVAITRHKFLTAEWQTFTSYVAGPKPTTVEEYENEILSRDLPPTVLPSGSPIVEITNIRNDSAFINPTEIAIEVAASDTDGTVSKVEYYIGDTLAAENTVSPYGFTWNSPIQGEHTIKVRATDNDGKLSKIDSIHIIVFPSQPPMASITSPVPNEIIPVDSIVRIQTEVSDNDGLIQKVEFFSGVIKLGEITTEPFNFNWSSAAPGLHTIHIIATDNSGAMSQSEKVNIQVLSSFTYTENFDDGIAQDWEVIAGTYSVTKGKFYTGSAGGNNNAVYSGVQFSNFSYTIDVNSHWNNWFGVLFNFQHDSNYYFVELSIPDSKVFLKYRENGTITKIDSADLAGLTSNVKYTVNIINGDGKTNVLVNGDMLISEAPTPELLSGKIGTYANYCRGDYDNVNVNGTGLYYPSAILITPGDSMRYYDDQDVTIDINASDQDGSVATILLYLNGQLLTQFDEEPYEFNAGVLPVGEQTFEIVLTDNDGLTRNVIQKINVIQRPTTSIDMLTEDDLNIYPIPVTGDYLFIENFKEFNIQSIDFFDISGKKIYSFSPENIYLISIEVNVLPSKGIYIMQIESVDKLLNKKVLVN